MDLLDNPFFLLGATIRDDRRRIMELAEEKSLLTESAAFADAASILTNPRKRLTAEVSWLLGIGPSRALSVLTLLQTDPLAIPKEINLPPLAKANLLAAGIVRAAELLSAEDAASWIVELARVHEGLRVEATLALINSERIVSHFPEVSDVQVVEAELAKLRQHFRRAIKEALDKLPPERLVQALTLAVTAATQEGQLHAPILIDDAVDSFEVGAQDFLDRETGTLRAIIAQIRAAISNKQGEVVVSRLIDTLERVLKNWDTVAQPIQVSARSRGLEHSLGCQVASEIRSLAVEMYNQHGELDLAQRITALLQEVFAEVSRLVEQATEDSAALDEIAEQRTSALREMQARNEEWRKEITYEAEWGLIFKDTVRISPEGVEVRGQLWPLDSITRVRWGGTRHSVNGIPTGTTYTIVIGSEGSEASLEMRREDIYSQCVDKLWKAVGVRLLTVMLEGLRSGRSFQFGRAVVDDLGVQLERRKVFSANERIHCRWVDLVIGNGAGTFHIARKDERKVSIELPYQEVDNVHILEAAMRVFWKQAGDRISSLLSAE